MSDWYEIFSREASTRDVPASVIRDVAAEVRSRCEKAGLDPVAEYGDPMLYARAVDETTPRESARQSFDISLIPAFLAPLAGVIGWQLGSRSIRAALDGTPVVITGGDLVWWAILLVGTVAVVGFLTRVLRRSLLLVAAAVALLGAAVLAAMYLQEPVSSIPLMVATTGAVAFLIASVVIWLRTEALLPRAPLERRLAPWTFPLLTILQGLITWALSFAA